MSVYKGYTEQQNAATKKYKKKVGIQRVSLDLPQGKREEWQKKAKAKGLSLTAYITKLIVEDE